MNREKANSNTEKISSFHFFLIPNLVRMISSGNTGRMARKKIFSSTNGKILVDTVIVSPNRIVMIGNSAQCFSNLQMAFEKICFMLFFFYPLRKILFSNRCHDRYDSMSRIVVNMPNAPADTEIPAQMKRLTNGPW